MKTLRILIIITIVPLLAFTMGVDGCGTGAIQLSATEVQSEEPTLEDMWEQELQRYNMEMPVVSVVDGRIDGDEEDLVQERCLMNYVDDANLLASIETQGIRDTLYKFGLDNFDNDEIKQQIDDAVVHTKEFVGVYLDSGKWAILIRLADGITMSEFLSNFLSPIINNINKDIDQDEDRLVPLVLDNSTVITSPFPEVRDAVALRVERDLIEYKCAFYRINKCSALNARPMIYVFAKGRTSLWDSVLENAVPDDVQEDLRNIMGVVGVDMKDGVYRFYFGLLSDTNALTADVISYFSFYVDTDSYLLRMFLDRASDALINGGN